MGIQTNGSLVHWNYYIALEQDRIFLRFQGLLNSMKINFEIYSMELAHLLLASASEVDVVLKALCNIKDASKDHHNISYYRKL